MIQNCTYCKKSYIAERRSRRYCSDNCRQMAYLSRKGSGSLGGDSDYVLQEHIAAAKADNPLKYSKRTLVDTNKGNVLEGIGPLKNLLEKVEAVQSLITQQNNLILTMWTSLKAELESTRVNLTHELHKELSKHNPFWRGLNGLDYCSPCTVKRFVETTVSPNTTENGEQHAISEKLREQIKELKEKLIQKDKKEPAALCGEEQLYRQEGEQKTYGPLQEDKELIEQAEEPNRWVIPRLHTYIQRQLDKGDGGYRFLSPLRYWPLEDAKNILWVNVRLRCLLDNMVRLSLRSHTNYETLAALTDAFIDLSNSREYKDLPSSYPYKNLIAEQTDVFQKLIRGRAPGIKGKWHLWMTTRHKSLIVAACTELCVSTEKVRFRELSFESVKLTPSLIEKANTLT